MSGENVEIVKRAVQALNERDLETLRDLWHPNVEYHGLGEWPDRPRVLRGLEELEPVLTLADDDFDDARSETQELIDAGDRVVIVFEVNVIGKQSRAPVRFTDAAVYTISAGLITRIEICGTREKALEAVGLSE